MAETNIIYIEYHQVRARSAEAVRLAQNRSRQPVISCSQSGLNSWAWRGQWMKLQRSPKRQWPSCRNVPHSLVLYLELRLLFFLSSWEPWANLQLRWQEQQPNSMNLRHNSDFSLLANWHLGVLSGENDSSVDTELAWCLQLPACSPFSLNILLPSIRCNIFINLIKPAWKKYSLYPPVLPVRLLGSPSLPASDPKLGLSSTVGRILGLIYPPDLVFYSPGQNGILFAPFTAFYPFLEKSKCEKYYQNQQNFIKHLGYGWACRLDDIMLINIIIKIYYLMQPGRQIGIKEKLANTCVKWSPHSPDLLALGSAENFGVVGKGIVQVKRLQGDSMQTIAIANEKDAIFDMSWFEMNDQFILVGSGSGDALFWHIGQGIKWAINLKGEIHSVECAYKNPLFVAGCNTGFIHVGDCEAAKLLFAIPGHSKNCNEVKWHPSSDKVFATGGADGLLKMWDHTLPKPNISTHQAHQAEILSLDFNKYEEQIVTCSIDKSIRVWDLRNLVQPINVLNHHRYPPKRVRFSPHAPWLLTSGSFDMNVHFYDLRDVTEPLKMKGAQHTQFVTGVQFSLFDQKQVASVGWDGRLLVWDWDKPQPAII